MEAPYNKLLDIVIKHKGNSDFLDLNNKKEKEKGEDANTFELLGLKYKIKNIWL